jgi:hypothetical protein
MGLFFHTTIIGDDEHEVQRVYEQDGWIENQFS